MASITIRNLDESLKAQLRLQAAQHGHSMEEEVRIILCDTLTQTENSADKGLGSRIRARFAGADKGEDLPLPDRDEAPRAADLGP